MVETVGLFILFLNPLGLTRYLLGLDLYNSTAAVVLYVIRLHRRLSYA